MSGKTEWVMVPREPTEAMHTAHAMYGDTSDWWNAVLVAAPQPPAEPQAQGGGAVVVETVGFVRENSDGDRYIDWTVEGGIGALEDGEELIVVSATRLTDDTGSGTVHTAPPSAPVGVDAGLFPGDVSRDTAIMQLEDIARRASCGMPNIAGEILRVRTGLIIGHHAVLPAPTQQTAAVDGEDYIFALQELADNEGSETFINSIDADALRAAIKALAAQPGGSDNDR